MRFVDENTKGEVEGFKFYINVCAFSYHNIINQICKNRIISICALNQSIIDDNLED